MFNTVNLHVYHYGGNNSVKYVDPDGRFSVAFWFNEKFYTNLQKVYSKYYELVKIGMFVDFEKIRENKEKMDSIFVLPEFKEVAKKFSEKELGMKENSNEQKNM